MKVTPSQQEIEKQQRYSPGKYAQHCNDCAWSLLLVGPHRPSYPASSFLWPAVGNERPWKDPISSDLKSENSGLPVELRMPNLHCASFRRSFNIIFLVSSSNPEINMATMARMAEFEFGEFLVWSQADHSLCSCLRRESMRVMNKALKIAHLNHVLVWISQ